MAASRLTLALDDAGLPEQGRIAVFAPTVETDLSALPRDRIQVISRDAVVHDALRGVACATTPEGPYAAAIVIVPRAKAEAQALVAAACAATPDGLILVDGQKTDGVDSLYKACRSRVALTGQIAKAHGRAFWFASNGGAFADWTAGSRDVGGFVTRPGVFSADGVDPGSALLADHLPAKLGRDVADLGAGWGFIAAQALRDPAIVTLHLVESDAVALDCARRNVGDDRARFHWADVTRWEPPTLFDTVLMNPPFHTGRKGAPDLGRAFIATARRILRPSGQLVLVANRHLPYEAALHDKFAAVEETAGSPGFKILRASRPKRDTR